MCHKNPDPDMAKEVRHRVAKRMSQVAAYTGAITEGGTASDGELQQALRWRRALKSGLHWTGPTMVLNKVTWPHEVVYTSASKLAAYQDILFRNI